MSDCLLVLNPRDIYECVQSIKALPIDRVWLRGYTEVELVEAVAEVIATTDYDNYIAVSDDGVVPRCALEHVQVYLGLLGHPVVTGYSNLALTDWRVNLCKTPLRYPYPHTDAYDLYDWQEVVSGPPLCKTYFAGMCLTGMSRDMWLRFPFDCFGRDTQAGNASDFKLSQRLVEAGIPIVAPREAFVLHVKQEWNQADTDEAKLPVHMGKRETVIECVS